MLSAVHNARALLAQYIGNHSTLYIVQTHASRTNHKRHYLILTIDAGVIADITPTVCRALANPFDRDYGTYNITGAIGNDAHVLAQSINGAIGILPRVVTL